MLQALLPLLLLAQDQGSVPPPSLDGGQDFSMETWQEQESAVPS